jgi:thiosulfate dehydrogenase (quinone) large subunit
MHWIQREVQEMMFVFAYLGTLTGSSGWPVRLMYFTELLLIICTIVCLVLAMQLQGEKTERAFAVAAAGGVSASFALIMPFELAPFFFGARGEIMMATLLLNLFYIPAAFLFFYMFKRGMRIA